MVSVSPLVPFLLRVASRAAIKHAAREAIGVMEGPSPGRKTVSFQVGGFRRSASVPARFDSLDDLPL